MPSMFSKETAAVRCRSFAESAGIGADDKAERLLPKISKQRLAKLADLTPSHVNLVMKKFARLGFISGDGGLIINIPCSVWLCTNSARGIPAAVVPCCLIQYTRSIRLQV